MIKSVLIIGRFIIDSSVPEWWPSGPQSIASNAVFHSETPLGRIAASKAHPRGFRSWFKWFVRDK